jgi:cytochrome P450
METTIATLTFAIIYMLRYPDVQRRVREEINRVVGVDRAITMADKTQLPYTSAVIQVSIRL